MLCALCKWRFGSQSASTKKLSYTVNAPLLCHHHRDQNHQMPRITYKTIIRQIEQLLIAASLLEVILGTVTSDDLPAPAGGEVETEVRA